MMAMLFASLDLRQSNNQDEGSGDSKSAASQPSNYSDPRRQPVFLILQKILPVLYHFAANWYTEQDVTVVSTHQDIKIITHFINSKIIFFFRLCAQCVNMVYSLFWMILQLCYQISFDYY